MNTCYPDYSGDPAKQHALAQLEQLGACIGVYDKTTIHVELTPPYGHKPIGDSQLSTIVNCVNVLANVRNLDLGETAITDASAHELARLEGVTYLSLNGTSISDLAIPYLKSAVGLKELVLSGTAVSDLAIDQILQFCSLTFLQLYGTQMSAQGLAKLKSKLPGVVEA
jgi:Leucine-rich repeat (LRR) protein